MDGEAWWAAVYGVAQSWTRLMRLSSSSSSSCNKDSPKYSGLNHLQVHFRHRFKSGLVAQRAVGHKLYNNVTLPSSTRISIFGCKEAPSHLPSKHQKMVKLQERASYSLYNLLKLSTSYFVSK